MERAAIEQELLDIKKLLHQATWPHDQTISVLILACSDILLLIEYTENLTPQLACKRAALGLVNQALQQLDVIYLQIDKHYLIKPTALNQINTTLVQAIDTLLLAYR